MSVWENSIRASRNVNCEKTFSYFRRETGLGSILERSAFSLGRESNLCWKLWSDKWSGIDWKFQRITLLFLCGTWYDLHLLAQHFHDKNTCTIFPILYKYPLARFHLWLTRLREGTTIGTLIIQLYPEMSPSMQSCYSFLPQKKSITLVCIRDVASEIHINTTCLESESTQRRVVIIRSSSAALHSI